MDAHWTDHEGRPAGGCSSGTGYTISWQNGPCPIEADGSQPARNGAFLIEVLESCLSRLEFYQEGDFACGENEMARKHLLLALIFLRDRRDRRKERGVLGTHEK